MNEAEKFIKHVIVGVPNIKQRFATMRDLGNFEDQLSALDESAEVLLSACQEVRMCCVATTCGCLFTSPRCLWSQIRASARLRSLLLDVVLPLGNHLNQVCGGAWVPRVSRCLTLTMLVCVGCVCGFRMPGYQEGHCAGYQVERVASHH